MTTPENTNGQQPAIEAPETITVAQGNGELQKESMPEQTAAPAQPAPPPKPTRILLIRHGVNDYVKKGLLAGQTADVHLNTDGMAQARALAERLANEKFAPQIAALYSSPLERCQETAQPVAERLGLELRTLEDVKETHCGDWTGQPLEELRKQESWAQVQIHPSGFRFPGGESMLEIQTRMVTALDKLQREHTGETIAVFSHSDPIKLALAFYIGAPLDLFQRLEISPASISELDFSPLRVRLIRMNDAAHVPAPAEEPAADEPKAEQETDVTKIETEESPAAKGAVEEQIIKGPPGVGPEPAAVTTSDEGKMQATGG